MPVETIYTLAESNISISGGGQLSGITQGDGSHLDGLTITLNNNDWTAVNVFDSDANFQDSDNSQTLEGAQVYDGVSYAAGLRVEAEYSLTLEDPDGNTYTVLAFNINEPGVTSYATVEGLAFIGGVGGFPPIGVPLTVVASSEGPSNPFVDLASPPCFTRGTKIETSCGLRPVEELSLGDLVKTRSNGYQTVRWIGSQKYSQIAFRANPKLMPVRIVAGALGHGLPKRDLLVSRQHRLMASSRIVERMFKVRDVLIPAHKMTALPGIYLDDSMAEVEFFHFLFDDHQIVYAEGAPTESLYTGPEAMKAISTEARDEIFTLFPQLKNMTYAHAPALPIAAGKKLTLLVARHLKHDKPVLETYKTAL
ncbi:Hint domain-containing protein [Yoonia sp.]|uniref:Hint domain-containing protein n=1 Tax=Yoonia sp. TaxID=2212373 RepID=UPI0025E29D26|nr:Hint domain-containing protein [Yoonia sp.]